MVLISLPGEERKMVGNGRWHLSFSFFDHAFARYVNKYITLESATEEEAEAEALELWNSQKLQQTYTAVVAKEFTLLPENPQLIFVRGLVSDTVAEIERLESMSRHAPGHVISTESSVTLAQAGLLNDMGRVPSE